MNAKKINPKIVTKKEKHVINNNLNEFLSKEEENIDDIFGPRNNNGEGKEYNEYGELIFEGEYLNGKRNGKGKKYDFDGNLIF